MLNRDSGRELANTPPGASPPVTQTPSGSQHQHSSRSGGDDTNNDSDNTLHDGLTDPEDTEDEPTGCDLLAYAAAAFDRRLTNEQLNPSPDLSDTSQWLSSFGFRRDFIPTYDVGVAVRPEGILKLLPFQSGGPFEPKEKVMDTFAERYSPNHVPRSNYSGAFGRGMARLATMGFVARPDLPSLLPSPAELYDRWSKADCAGMLVCARTIKEGSTSELTEPFYMVVGCPTAFRGGRIRSSIWNIDSSNAESATLLPSGIHGPSESAHVILANIHPGLRIPTALGNRSPGSYLDAGTVICFSDDGDMFKFIRSESATNNDPPRIRSAIVTSTHGHKETIWQPRDDHNQDVAIDFGYLISASKPTDKRPPTNATHLCNSPKFVAFPTPLMLPLGPLCPASEGVEGLRRVIGQRGHHGCVRLLDHVMVREFLHKVSRHPELMCTTWISRRWIKDSLAEDSTTPGWASPGDCDLWLDAERRLAYRLHHDFLSTTAVLSKRVRDSYFRYVQRAYEGVYTATSDLGVIPLPLAGELYYLRPPAVRLWDTTMHLGSWVTEASVAPSTRKYLVIPVPKEGNWQPLPLETITEAEDRRAKEAMGSNGIRQPSSLAADRMARYHKRTHLALLDATAPDDTPRVTNLRTSNSTSPPDPVDPMTDSPITITGVRQPSSNPTPRFPTTDDDYTVTHHAPCPRRFPHISTTSTAPGSPTRQELGSKRPRFIDTDTDGFLTGSPVRPSRQFCERHDNNVTNPADLPYPHRVLHTQCVRQSIDRSDQHPYAPSTQRNQTDTFPSLRPGAPDNDRST